MTHTSPRIAIIGGGFSGLSLALELRARSPQPLQILLMNSGSDFARGTAYSTPYPNHLLNVPAAKMSAFRDEPDHLLRWLGEHRPTARFTDEDVPLAKQFVPRQVYGDYLTSLLDAAGEPGAGGASIERISGRVTGATPQGPGGWTLALEGDASFQADVVVLATGNEAPRNLFPHLDGDVYLNNPWAWPDLRRFLDKPSLLLVGTGLTMVDVTLTVFAEGYAGTLVALSRRGLTPKAHRWNVAPTSFALDLAAGAAGPEAVRDQIEAHLAQHPEDDWRAVIDSLRPHTQTLWKAWSGDAKARFMKEHRAPWDVRRHRISPDIARRLAELRDSGRLELLTAGVADAETGDDGQVRVSFRATGTTDVPAPRAFAGVINCTGPECDATAVDQPLLRSLLDQGLIRQDALRFGLDVDDQSALRDAHGEPTPRLFAVGPITRAHLWEIIAVPDIRQQTAALAEHLITTSMG